MQLGLDGSGTQSTSNFEFDLKFRGRENNLEQPYQYL